MVKEMTIILTASANNQEGIDSEFEYALKEVSRLVEQGFSSGLNSREDGDQNTNIEYTEGIFFFTTKEL